MRRLVVLALFLHTMPALAYPFLALRPGGTPFEGATDAELSAVWWNPAALAEMRGLHLGGTGQLVLDSGAVARSPLCTTRVTPKDACGPQQSFPSAPISDLSGTGLGGVSWDFKQDNLTLAFAVFAPWEAHRSFAGNGGAGSTDAPTAYHLRDESFSTLYYSLALAFKLTKWFNAGISVGLTDSQAEMSFDRDTASAGGTAQVAASNGYENPSQAQRISVRGDGGTIIGIPAPTGLSLGLGTLFHLGRVDLGLSFTHMFPLVNSGHYASASDNGAVLTPAAAQNMPCTGNCVGGDSIEYDIPDVWHLGMKYRLRPNLELESTLRVVVYGSRIEDGYQSTPATQALVVRLAGDPVTKGGAPERILFARGLTPTFAGEVGIRWRPKKWLRLGASIAAESSAVPTAYVDAEAMDAPKVDGMLAVEVRPIRWLRVMLGYEVTALIFGSPAGSAYDPYFTANCVDMHFALNQCAEALEGRGLPSAAGNYSLYTQRFSAGLMLDID